MLILDMVHHNPGEPQTFSKFLEASALSSCNYNGQVWADYIQAAITYKYFDKDFLKGHSGLVDAIESRAANISRRIERDIASGIKAFFHTDFLVIPKIIRDKYREHICNDEGKIDLHLPVTQDLIKSQLNEIFDRFPGLDGLVVRHGETYLHDIPQFVGNSPISRGAESHVLLINILREEVCVKRGKYILYRTWDFQGIHTNREKYLEVTGQIDVHPNLFFSIKHTNGDYWRSVPFNETLMVGKHRQIIEIQCQREYEGKGSHPNYIAEGVINGFEELSEIMPEGAFKCLKDVQGNPLFAGIYTWSRGGGWNGPYIQSEFWIELNARVLAKWTKQPDITEENHFFSILKEMGIDGEDANLIRKISLLSQDAILRGQYSIETNPYLYQNQIVTSKSNKAYCIEDGIEILWTRDQFIGGSNEVKNTLESLHKEDLFDLFIAEKEKAVSMWEQIDKKSAKLMLYDHPSLKEIIQVTCRYGLLKFNVFAISWKVLIHDYKKKNNLISDLDIDGTVKEYNKLKREFIVLKDSSVYCPSLYSFDYCRYISQVGMKDSPGVDSLIARLFS